jgi:hypothetical protein
MIIRLIFVLILVSAFGSCFTAGTHGSIKQYSFMGSSSIVKEAVKEVILNNKSIYIDSSQNIIVNIDNSVMDTRNLYSDGMNYLTINICNKNKNEIYKYVIHYAESQNQDSLNDGSFSLVYAFDNNGEGGSENSGLAWYKFSLRKKLIELFENEFVNKVDSVITKAKNESVESNYILHNVHDYKTSSIYSEIYSLCNDFRVPVAEFNP